MAIIDSVLAIIDSVLARSSTNQAWTQNTEMIDKQTKTAENS